MSGVAAPVILTGVQGSAQTLIRCGPDDVGPALLWNNTGPQPNGTEKVFLASGLTIADCVSGAPTIGSRACVGVSVRCVA